MANRVVETMRPQPGECRLEIGPGLGALTWRLAAAGACVAAVERDARLAGWLRAQIGDDPRVVVVEGDATRRDLETVARDAWGTDTPYEIASNLPYGIGSVVLTGLARLRPRLRRAVVMLQSEVADRLLADPGTSAYGSLTAAVGRAWNVRSLVRVPATCFWPRPEVSSCVVELVHASGIPELHGVEERWFEMLLRAGFGQRRKQMGKALSKLPIAPDTIHEAIVRIGARPEARFETLRVESMVELARILAQGKGR
jgi:16S rRNA (adenine1518-N6/adenine1519-N6)-dimethyltransferase